MNSYLKSMIFGSLIGGIIFIILLLEFAFGFHTNKIIVGEVVALIRYPIIIIGVVFALKKIIKTFKLNPIASKITHGLLLSLAVALTVGLSQIIYLQFIHPDYGEDYENFFYQKIGELNISEEHKELKIMAFSKSMEQYTQLNTPWGAAKYYFLETLLISGLTILIASFILKHKKKDFTPIQNID